MLHICWCINLTFAAYAAASRHFRLVSNAALFAYAFIDASVKGISDMFGLDIFTRFSKLASLTTENILNPAIALQIFCIRVILPIVRFTLKTLFRISTETCRGLRWCTHRVIIPALKAIHKYILIPVRDAAAWTGATIELVFINAGHALNWMAYNVFLPAWKWLAYAAQSMLYTPTVRLLRLLRRSFYGIL